MREGLPRYIGFDPSCRDGRGHEVQLQLQLHASARSRDRAPVRLLSAAGILVMEEELAEAESRRQGLAAGETVGDRAVVGGRAVVAGRRLTPARTLVAARTVVAARSLVAARTVVAAQSVVAAHGVVAATSLVCYSDLSHGTVRRPNSQNFLSRGP